MTTITKERLLTIRQWRETYGPGSNVVLPAEEAEKLARIALASLEAKPIGAFHIAEQQVDGTSDYIKDGEYRLLTSEEQKIAQLLGDAWNLYFTLPVEHPMGRDDFAGQFIIAKIWCWHALPSGRWPVRGKAINR